MYDTCMSFRGALNHWETEIFIVCTIWIKDERESGSRLETEGLSSALESGFSMLAAPWNQNVEDQYVLNPGNINNLFLHAVNIHLLYRAMHWGSRAMSPSLTLNLVSERSFQPILDLVGCSFLRDIPSC